MPNSSITATPWLTDLLESDRPLHLNQSKGRSQVKQKPGFLGS
ncbi:hypothetical protein [Oscillatoria sp. HE19RPO]|nr:hypothetical protein [Oscillatoria sp. HE19RPO]